MDLFKITAAVMHWGNQKWKQKPREEQAEADGQEECEKVAKLLGLEIDPFIMGLLKPKIKARLYLKEFYPLYVHNISKVSFFNRSAKNS